MKTIIFFILLLCQVSQGQTLLKNSTPVLGPLKNNAIKLKVLDSFSGSTKWHGQVVEIISSNFYGSVEADQSGLIYNVEVSKAEVMKKYTAEELFQVRIQSGFIATNSETQYALNISDFITELEKAGREGVKVVNYSVASLHAYMNIEEYSQISRILNTYDMILVVPSGNEGLYATRYPCRYNHPKIVCVAAGTQSYVLAGPQKDGIILDKYSNINDQVKFVSYGYFDKAYGTSFAAPRVAAALALVWSVYPTKNSTEVIAELSKYGRFVDGVTLSNKLLKLNYVVVK